MRARAPGKLVLAGAYAVLEGAPALVAAVDRFVVAETGREPERVTEELQVALARGWLARAPWFDASALRASAPSDCTGLSMAAPTTPAPHVPTNWRLLTYFIPGLPSEMLKPQAFGVRSPCPEYQKSDVHVQFVPGSKLVVQKQHTE